MDLGKKVHSFRTNGFRGFFFFLRSTGIRGALGRETRLSAEKIDVFLSRHAMRRRVVKINFSITVTKHFYIFSGVER